MLLLTFLSALAAWGQATPATAKRQVVYMDTVSYNKQQFQLLKNKGDQHGAIYLKAKADSANSTLTIPIHVSERGTYVFYSSAALISKADPGRGQAGSYLAGWQFNGKRPSSRIIFDGYNGGQQLAGKFDLVQGKNMLILKLPHGVALRSVSYQKYIPPGVPDAVLNYRPEVTPPALHPRLWVTPQFLPVLKERLTRAENSAAWHEVTKEALKKSSFRPDTSKEMYFNENLEQTIRTKAFYYLVTQDPLVGQEAIYLLKAYYSVLSFGNVTYGDITREMGRAIYTGALVYDWCYPLLGPADKASFRRQMLSLARDMEIGWPPFIDPIVNGHANEAQVSRDLLSMSIAIYNEDSLPYRYVSYALLKELVPMRAFEYQSSRHNQGVDYGAYRFGWEMHGAMLFYRMLGRKIYPENISNMAYYWLNMRLPNGYMLRDGDMFSNKRNLPGDYYWKQPQTMLLCYAYMHDSLMKGEFLREGGLPDDPVLYLLLNDPDLKAVRSTRSLSTTHDFGPVLGGMMARTGWDNEAKSSDVVAEIRGGGYLFGNHQHSDAGAIQLYYHGMQFGDIGLYLSYGSPYDYNFNKRSVSHSMMLAYDPLEKLYFGAKTNDGGTRFNQRFPVSPHQTVTDPWFNAGSVLATDQGPDFKRPYYSYFKAELSPAYAAKVSHYSRSFCLINPKDRQQPKILILTDNMQTSKAAVKKIWQLNAYNVPSVSRDHILMHSSTAGITGYTRMDMVYPEAADLDLTVKGGDSSRAVFGTCYPTDSSFKESRAYRIMISPRKATPENRFVTVFQMTEDSTKVLPVDYIEGNHACQLKIGSLRYVMSNTQKAIADSVSLNIVASYNDYKVKLLATDLEPGFWHIRSLTGSAKGQSVNFYVRAGKNTLFTQLSTGRYLLLKGRDYNGTYTAPESGRPYTLEYTPVAAPVE